MPTCTYTGGDHNWQMGLVAARSPGWPSASARSSSAAAGATFERIENVLPDGGSRTLEFGRGDAESEVHPGRVEDVFPGGELNGESPSSGTLCHPERSGAQSKDLRVRTSAASADTSDLRQAKPAGRGSVPISAPGRERVYQRGGPSTPLHSAQDDREAALPPPHGDEHHPRHLGARRDCWRLFPVAGARRALRAARRHKRRERGRAGTAPARRAGPPPSASRGRPSQAASAGQCCSRSQTMIIRTQHPYRMPPAHGRLAASHRHGSKTRPPARFASYGYVAGKDEQENGCFNDAFAGLTLRGQGPLCKAGSSPTACRCACPCGSTPCACAGGRKKGLSAADRPRHWAGLPPPPLAQTCRSSRVQSGCSRLPGTRLPTDPLLLIPGLLSVFGDDDKSMAGDVAGGRADEPLDRTECATRCSTRRSRGSPLDGRRSVQPVNFAAIEQGFVSLVQSRVQRHGPL